LQFHDKKGKNLKERTTRKVLKQNAPQDAHFNLRRSAPLYFFNVCLSEYRMPIDDISPSWFLVQSKESILDLIGRSKAQIL